MTALTVYVLISILYVVSAKLVFAFNLFIHRQEMTPKQLEEEKAKKPKKKKKDKEGDDEVVEAWDQKEKSVEEDEKNSQMEAVCAPVAKYDMFK